MNYDKISYHKINIRSLRDDVLKELEKPQTDIIKFNRLHDLLKTIGTIDTSLRILQKDHYII